MTNTLVFSSKYLQSVYEAIYRKLGASAEEGQILARCFVNTDLRGKDTQGIALLPYHYSLYRSGAIRLGAPLRVIKESAGVAVVDGGQGSGHVVATKAMEIALQKARESIVATVWVCNTNDFGMASNYSMMALEHDCIGLAMSTGSTASVAPWGGRDRIFGTCPVSIAIPAGEEKPIVIDMATSSVSGGKVLVAARDHLRVPGLHLVDASGKFTDDPTPLVVDSRDRALSQALGAILPLGPKGFGWLLFVDIFAGLISGMTREPPSSRGDFLMAIDVGLLMPISEFRTKVDALVRRVKSSRRAEGFDDIVLPGEAAAREAERRQREGVPVREEDWLKVSAIARELGLDLEAFH